MRIETEDKKDNVAMSEVDRSKVEAIYRSAVKRYISKRHAMVDDFVEENFSIKGSINLHKKSLGWDVLKTPVNAAGSLLTVIKGAGAAGSRILGANHIADSLDKTNLFMETKIGKEIEWKIRTELFELPFNQDGRQFNSDELMCEVMRDPEMEELIIDTFEAIDAQHNNDEFKERLTLTLEEYLGSRAAACDISVSLMAASAGMLALHKITPGIASLSGGIASGLAHSAAIKSFWAGPYAGAMFYSVFSAATPPLLAAGVFAALIVPASAIATFSGIATDPIQKKMGIHSKRLHKIVDCVEDSLLGESNKTYVAKDHYVARIFDFIDWATLVVKTAKQL